MATKVKLTDRYLQALKAAEPGRRFIVYDVVVDNFGIRVTEKSRKDSVGSFVMVARFPGSSNPVTRRIGDYPSMSLARAREIAQEWREDIRSNIDPKVKETERLWREERERKNTFAAIFNVFVDDHLSTLRTGTAVAACVRRYCSDWAPRPLSELRRRDVSALIKSVKVASPIGANRLLAYLKVFFRWAVKEEYIEASPAADIDRPSSENQRDRVLRDDEIRAIWTACGELGPFGAAFRLMLLLGQRRTEVGSMTWPEIDFKEEVWRLARERTKADRPHEVPLSRLAVSIIESCPKVGEYVLSTGRRSPTPRPISGWGKAKEKLDRLSGVSDWRLHDLRRTCATHLAKLGVERLVVSKILNHSEGGVTHIYERHGYDREKRAALDLWANRVESIVSDGSERCDRNVIVMRRGAQ
jgi:integrase